MTIIQPWTLPQVLQQSFLIFAEVLHSGIFHWQNESLSFTQGSSPLPLGLEGCGSGFGLTGWGLGLTGWGLGLTGWGFGLTGCGLGLVGWGFGFAGWGFGFIGWGLGFISWTGLTGAGCGWGFGFSVAGAGGWKPKTFKHVSYFIATLL